ncbi:hypothetical protein [Aquimarina pacifica]|uniref:hypothetical protein n=1 Tax=Aquimarina pacifica TaxID=1296415 RepID=UPI000472F41D|nr:hypothetical protein [Aquimarina pacifica]
MRFKEDRPINQITYICLTVFIFLSSCKTEEDKYPEMVVFEPNMKGDFRFEEIDPIPKYYRDTDKYVFFLTNNSIPESKVVIYNKKSKTLIKTLPLIDNKISINSDGIIYGFDEKTEKAFKYSPPEYKKIFLEKYALDYVSYENLENIYSSEIKDKKLQENQSELDYFLKKKRYKVLKEKFIDTLLCITKLDKSNTAIAHFKNKEVYLDNSSYLYKGTFIKSKLKGVSSCKPSNYKLYETTYFNKSPLNQFDSVTLDYNFTGSNHFVIGMSSNNLFYYELKLEDKSVKFKFPHPIRNIVNLDGLIILETTNRYFKVSMNK